MSSSRLTAPQRELYARYGRQLYRMMLRVADDERSLPTATARQFLRQYARESFRRHRDVASASEAEELLQRAHTTLLIIAEDK